MAQSLGVHHRDQWYQIDSTKIKPLDTERIVQKKFRSSVPLALMSVYDDHQWKPWLFHRMPRGMWNDPAVQKQYFDWLSTQLAIGDNLERWYGITTDQIISHSGTQLLQRVFNHSLAAALKVVYPHHEWHEWKFSVAPRNYWSDPAAPQRFFDWISLKLGITDDRGVTHLERWYSIKRTDITQHGGAGVLRKFENSLARALMTLYPAHDWEPWRFEMVPISWWTNVSNQRRFFEAIRLKLGVETMEDWYGISGKAVQDLGANGLMPYHYRGSIVRALMTVYPEHEWDPWRFSRVSSDTLQRLLSEKPRQYTSAMARRYLDGLADKLKITSPQQWSLVRPQDLERLKATIPIASLGGLKVALELAYPEHFSADKQPNS
jgi:hypothetical protein